MKLPFTVCKLTGNEPYEAILSDNKRHVVIDTKRVVEFKDSNYVLYSQNQCQKYVISLFMHNSSINFGKYRNFSESEIKEYLPKGLYQQARIALDYETAKPVIVEPELSKLDIERKSRKRAREDTTLLNISESSLH